MARRPEQSETSDAAPSAGAPARGWPMPYQPRYADLAPAPRRPRMKGEERLLERPLQPELAEAFPNAKAVNEALRGLLDVAATIARLTRRSTGRAKQQRAS